MSKLSVILLHDQMVDKRGDLVTTSLTLIDLHDISRSSKTYGAQNFFISHSGAAMRKIAKTLRLHWEEGFGATYNPNRKEALGILDIVSSLDEAIHKIDTAEGRLPKLVATSARPGNNRVSFSEMREKLSAGQDHYLLMLGTGWGMSEELLSRADYFLEPINGPTDYNHLSVRSACAIMLDRLLAPKCILD